MVQPKIKFIHLCDAATIDGTGKLNILGIFGKIYLQDIPSKFPKFTAVVSVRFEETPAPKNNLEIKILGQKDEELNINPPIKIEFKIPKIDKQKKPELNLVLDINNLEFKSFGKHVLSVFLNDKRVGSESFDVEKREVK